MGGALGLALASGALRALIAWTTVVGVSSVPRLQSVTLDWRVPGVHLRGVVRHWPPLRRHSRARDTAGRSVLAALRGEGRATESEPRASARAQSARGDPGCVGGGAADRRRVDDANVRRAPPGRSGFSGAATLQSLRIGILVARREEARARAGAAGGDPSRRSALLPGVTAAAVASIAADGGRAERSRLRRGSSGGGRDDPAGTASPLHVPGLHQHESGGRLVAGRDFTWDETRAARPVAMVSENLRP